MGLSGSPQLPRQLQQAVSEAAQCPHAAGSTWPSAVTGQQDQHATDNVHRPALHAPASCSSTAPWGTLQTRHAHNRANNYSVLTGTPRPRPDPVLELLRSPEEHLWQRQVLRPPSEVQVVQQGSQLLLTGRAGSVKLDMTELDPTGLVAFKLMQMGTPGLTGAGAGRAILVVASPDKARFQTVFTALERAVQGVMQGFLLALTVKGVGYRLEPVEEVVTRPRKFFEQNPSDKTNFQYPYNKPVSAVRLRVGYSRPVIFPLPPDVRAFCLKPTLLYLYGLQEERLSELAQQIRSIRKPNVYTGNGIQLVGEVLKTKQRTSRKAK